MKKVSKTAKRVLTVILAIVVCIAVYKTCAIVKFEASAKAEYIFLQHDTTEIEIHYNGRVYKSQSYIPNNYDVYKNYQDVRANRVYIKNDYVGFFYYFVTPLLFFNDRFDYFVYACPEEDPTGSFIICDPHDSSINMTYVAEDFVFPEPSEDTVDFIRATYTGSEIYDKETVSKFANAALSGEEIEIDDELLSKFHYYPNYGVGSWDFWFEYKDCPLYSRYCIIKTESGKYQVIKRSELY